MYANICAATGALGNIYIVRSRSGAGDCQEHAIHDGWKRTSSGRRCQRDERLIGTAHLRHLVASNSGGWPHREKERWRTAAVVVTGHRHHHRRHRHHRHHLKDVDYDFLTIIISVYMISHITYALTFHPFSLTFTSVVLLKRSYTAPHNSTDQVTTDLGHVGSP